MNMIATDLICQCCNSRYLILMRWRMKDQNNQVYAAALCEVCDDMYLDQEYSA